VVGQPGVINRYQDGSYQAYDINYSATLNSSEWKTVSTNFTFLGDETIGDKAENCLSFIFWLDKPDSNTDDYYIKDFVITKYVADYPELKVTVDEKTSYLLNEKISHTVYGVKDGAETPITSGVTYKSSNEGVVKVHTDGTIRAVGAGSATITAIYDRVPVQFNVTIGEVDGVLDLSKTEKTVLASDETSQMAVDLVKSDSTVQTLVKADGTEVEDVSFSTSDANVATVSESGLVTAKKPGTALITAEYSGTTKSLMMIVGNTTASKDFEKDSDFSVSDKTVANFDTKTRTGSGRSLWVNAYSSNQAEAVSSIFSAPQNYETVQWWYYDDGEDTNKGFFHFMTGSSPRLNLWIWPVSSGKFYPDNRENTTTSGGCINVSGYPKTKARSKGWHQVVINNDDGHITLYYDGELLLDGNMTEGAANKAVGIGYQRWSSEEGADIWMDDFAHVETVARHNVTVTYGENGTVKNGDADVVSGTPIQVKGGESLTLKVVANEGYQAKVTVDNQQVALQDDNTVTLSNITANKAVAVTFEKVITTPEISGSNADYIIAQDDYDTGDGEKHFAYVSYYKAAIPATYQVKGLGMNFGDGTNTIALPVNDWTTDYMFGVRVFGKAVKKENTYTFQGFAVVEDEEGNESTITTGEPITK